MKRTVKKVLLLVSLVVVMLAAMVITAFATTNENKPSATIAYCNLAFESNTIIQYAVKAEHVSNNSDVTLQIWTEEDYLAGKPASTTLRCLGTEQINNAEHLIFEYSELADKQMGDVVYARVAISGVLQEGVHKYSILQYIYSKLGKTGIASENEKFKTLLQKKLEVGAAAQEYFEYKTDRLVTSDFYQVKVKNGTLSDGCISGLYLEGETVTVTAPEVDEEGNNFSYWKNSDGKIISESAVYNLTVPAEHDTYTAVYVSSEGLVYTSNGDGTCCVSSIGTCTDAEINILSISPTGDRVTSIGDEAFSGCTTLKSITLPNSVTSIGHDAFSDCRSLMSVTFEESSQLTNIDYNAFRNCNQLMSITIPNRVTSIGDYAFSCNKLVEVYNLSDLDITEKSYANGAVGYNALNIYAPNRGESKLHITDDDYVFYVDDNVVYLIGYVGTDSALILPSDFKGSTYAIYEYAFCQQFNLTSIVIPESVASIGKFAFYDNSGLTICAEASSRPSGWNDDWKNPNYPVIWNFKEFYTDSEDCTYVLSKDGNAYLINYSGQKNAISIPTSANGYTVTEIGAYAFKDCTGLTDITLPNSVTSIGIYAFSGCTELTNITIPNSITSIGNRAFDGCGKLINITFEKQSRLKNIGNCAFYNCTGLKSIEIPSGVMSIGGYAFAGCTGLTSIILPNSVTSIGDFAFLSCKILMIYCEASESQDGWGVYWNYDNRPVYWNYQAT